MARGETCSVPFGDIEAECRAMGLQMEPMSAFVMVGPRRGVRVAIAKTKRVARVFVYNAQPAHPRVLPRDDRFREEMRYGNIRAEVDFSGTPEEAMDGVRACLRAVREHLSSAAPAGAATSA